jgi:uncharacterized damage-inducible protein DinB
MATHPAPLTTIFTGWEEFHQQLSAALAPLTAEQLDLSAAPHLRSIAAITGHIVATRVGWFHFGLSVGDESIQQYSAWDQPENRPRRAADLVAGLAESWALIRGALDSWSVEDMMEEVETVRGGKTYLLPRRWVIWHVIEHDLHHGGEVLLTLGIHNLPAPEIGPVAGHITPV